jgi:hypothetical protein
MNFHRRELLVAITLVGAAPTLGAGRGVSLAAAPTIAARKAPGLAVDRNYRGKVLELQFTVEDEGVFTMPWSAMIIYRRSSDEWPENVCAENPGRSPAVPSAAKPDF